MNAQEEEWLRQQSASAVSSAASMLLRVAAERWRQEELRRQGKFPATCATPKGYTRTEKLAVLAEEFGEVSRHIAESVIDPKRFDRSALQRELIEVAAVAVAWAESLADLEGT